MSSALSVEDIRSGYGETEILHGISLAVERGETYAVVGKNGTGKTTLLKTIVGLVRAQAGRVALFGEDVSTLPAHKIAGRSIGYAPQENAFFPDLSVRENLRLGGMNLGKDEFHERCEHVIELFPILGRRMRQRAGTLSGGEQKMLNVARALLPAPQIVLLDEASEGLQPSVIERIRAALALEQEASSLTLLLVEQNINFVLALANRYALIERGTIKGRGSVSDPHAKEDIEQHLAI